MALVKNSIRRYGYLIMTIIIYPLFIIFSSENIARGLFQFMILLTSYLLVPVLLWKRIKVIPLPLLVLIMGVHLIFTIVSLIVLLNFFGKVTENFIIATLAILNLFILYYIVVITLKSINYIHICLQQEKTYTIILVTTTLVLTLLLFPDFYYAQSYDLLLSLFQVSDKIKNFSQNYFSMFYYSFAVHFALSLNYEILGDMQKTIQSIKFLKIQQIVHVTVNKLTELVLISYVLSLLNQYFNKKLEPSKKPLP